jgi:hypothetical protein
MLDQFKSTVRPIITLLFCAVFLYGFVEKLVSAEVFVSTATLVIKYWFDSREPNGKKE